MIVGEAAAQVSPARRASLPEIPWPKIVGTRNRVVHHYFKVDLEIIWDIVDLDVSDLIQALGTEVPPDVEDQAELG